jgi:hypothetical protein
MVEFIKENFIIFTILASAATQLWSAAKLVAKNEALIKDLTEFRKDFAKHLDNYNRLAQEVSYLRGREGV